MHDQPLPTNMEKNMPAKTSTDNDIADEDIVPLADETASQAQRVVAAYAIDADECRMLLSMLGIEPTAKVE
ncbi:hypothetical protein [Rhodococcoides yunnanense]|uniref:hypothetical protein n=1 Tax=Rhodococcoides yunnanense TaxID=278209 RepID=UPI0022B1EB5D|nr:hypothetical protein [Rhodococcus yunnanensis]MCZ4274626.1 hypothetical protein [Rhodococcus yunnanensis]